MMYLEQLGLEGRAPNFRLIGASSRRGQRGWRRRSDPAAYLGRPPSSTSLRFSAVRDVVFEPQGDRISEDTWEWDVGTVDEAPRVSITMRPEEWRGWLTLLQYALALGGRSDRSVGVDSRSVPPVGAARNDRCRYRRVGAFAIAAAADSLHSVDNLGVSGVVSLLPLAVGANHEAESAEPQ
jgi:hypothetical protein